VEAAPPRAITRHFPGGWRVLGSPPATRRGAHTGPMITDEPRSVRHELFWLVPVGLTTLGATLFMLLNWQRGATAAAILTVPVEVVGIVVATLSHRGLLKPRALQALRVPAGRRRTSQTAVILVAVMLAGTLTVWWFDHEPSPPSYLSGDVRIGYAGSRYLGWHTEKNGTDIGFDADVARAIQDHFRFRSIVWVDLGTLDNRVAALNGRWRDAKGNLQDPVKLVISNFSMTPDKARDIDFAGPYFIDSEGFLSHVDAKTIADIPPGDVCVLTGSTSADRLRGYGWNPVERPSVAKCIEEYKNNVVTAVSADRSTLAGFAASLPKQLPPIDLQIGTEKYGVGLPNNSPKLCAEISGVLNDFIAYQWEKSFATNLKPLGLPPADYIRPHPVEPCQPPAPWYRA
jgi:ABC-type amino acid transport substrate-binding protein